MAYGRGNRRGLEDFPDPFASFGMGMGGGGSRRGSFFDVFENDPFFNDPFFTRPFGSFFGPTGGLFGANGFLGGNNLFGQQAPPPRPPAGYLEQRPHHQQQVRSYRARPLKARGRGERLLPHSEKRFLRVPTLTHSKEPQSQASKVRAKFRVKHANVRSIREVHRRDPIIEEVPMVEDDNSDELQAPSRLLQEPIIEHPDDDFRPAQAPEERPQQTRNVVRQGPLTMARNNNGRAYSFQSSSVSYGGPNGTYYSSSATRRLGPNGVIEEEFQEKDSTSGQETKRVSRGLGEKQQGRSITRKRTSEGREDTMETLHNLPEEEVPAFERTWEEREKSLPRWNKNRPHTIGSSHGSASRSRAALPSSGASQGGWPVNQY